MLMAQSDRVKFIVIVFPNVASIPRNSTGDWEGEATCVNTFTGSSYSDSVVALPKTPLEYDKTNRRR